MRILEGLFTAQNIKVAIVVARFNSTITQSLLEAALDGFKRHGFDESAITVAWVPGAFEIPIATQRLAASAEYDAIICLGAVIRGATPHFDYVAGPCASSIAQLALKFDLPIIFGVLTTDTIEQAVERSGVKHGNKGYDCALGAIEMISLLQKIPSTSPTATFS